MKWLIEFNTVALEVEAVDVEQAIVVAWKQLVSKERPPLGTTITASRQTTVRTFDFSFTFTRNEGLDALQRPDPIRWHYLSDRRGVTIPLSLRDRVSSDEWEFADPGR